MRLLRLRRLAWVLVLALTAGLAAPVFASTVGPGATDMVGAAHLHADGSGAILRLASVGAGSHAVAAGALPARAPRHCPGCAMAAECAASCLGVGILPALVLLPGCATRPGWLAAVCAEPAGAIPSGDIDPPRPVSVR